jgi:hypothetical protein
MDTDDQPLNPLGDHRVETNVIGIREEHGIGRVEEGVIELVGDRVDAVSGDKVMLSDR